jgi:predicted RecB family nuclease
VVKHVVKCEKWACSTLEVGKNKPILYITKTRDFKRFSEEIKEKSGILQRATERKTKKRQVQTCLFLPSCWIALKTSAELWAVCQWLFLP